MHRSLKFVIFALLAASLTGCRSGGLFRGSRQNCAPPPRSQNIPPPNIPVGPPPMAPVPRDSAPRGDAELLLPEAAPPGKSRSGYVPVPPSRNGAELGDPLGVPEKPKVTEPNTAAKPNRLEGALGIAEYTVVKDTIATGRRPNLDGLDWLQSRGFKTVIYLRGQDDDDTTDRRQVEKRGMEFVGLMATPETLIKPWVDEFNIRIGDSASRPIFVYSRDPAVGAAIWYLHFRTAEFLTHDEARLRVTRLGLKDESSPMFQAAVKLMEP